MQRLQHTFTKPEILTEALSHASYETTGGGRADYERLEFLGDRILGLIIAEWLFKTDTAADAGELAVRYNSLVRKETVAEVGRSIGLGEFMLMSPSEIASGGRDKDAILADTVEAVIAALYLDGGLDVAGRFIKSQWQDRIGRIDEVTKDPKTRLQELLQGRGEARPEYNILRQDGPPHDPEFTVEVRAGDNRRAEGIGRSRRGAEQAAAASLLQHLDSEI